MIRLKVFIPAVLLVVLSGVVGLYFIDAWVTRWAENGISAVTGTKTDISHLKLSFKNSSVAIERLQIAASCDTDETKDDEFKNAVEFEDIIIDFQALPLLHKRFVIDEFSVKGMAFGTKRTHSGKLPLKKKEPPSWISVQMEKAMGSLKKEAAELPVAKLLDFEVPSDPQEILKTLDLKSAEAFKASVANVQVLQSQWEAKFLALRDFSEYENKLSEVRKLAQNVPQNPEEILKTAETVKQTYDFFISEQRRMESLLGDVNADLKKIQAQYTEAKNALEADFDRAKKLVSLEALNVDNLSRMIFGAVWVERAETVLRYHALLRKAMASKSSGDAKVEVKKRGKGRDIIFVREKGAPSFVLAKSDFSMKTIEGGDRKAAKDLYEIKLKDLNSAPKLYGKPSDVTFRADLKDAILGEILFKAFWDYTTDIDKDDYSLVVDRLKADSWPVGIPKIFPLKLESGLAKAETKLHFDGDQMKWVSRIAFHGVKWDFAEVPKHGIILPVIEDVFSKLQNFHLDLELKSTKEGLDFDVKSDLDTALKTGIQAVVQKKLAEFQERLHREIESRIGVYRDQAAKQVSDFETGARKKVEGSVQKLASYAADTNRIQDELKKKAQDAAAGKVKEQIQKNINLPGALKGFKKPF